MIVFCFKLYVEQYFILCLHVKIILLYIFNFSFLTIQKNIVNASNKAFD